MKLLKTESPYLDKSQWKKLFLALSIMTICLYIVAMIFSLCENKYFILDYQNTQMDRIEAWFRNNNFKSLISWLFSTFEFAIILAFITNKIPKWYYLLIFYLPIAVIADRVQIPSIIYNILPIVFYIVISIIELAKSKELSWKRFGFCTLRLVISIVVTMLLQFIIFIIKSGNISFVNHDMSLSANFCYTLEYDIALLVILFTISLYINREKGDSKLWTEPHGVGGFSQTSKKQSQKSKLKNLTKTQRNKLRFLYVRIYLSQIFGFLLLMVLPFLLGKVFEFLMMYLAFAIARYILGFNYSLHYKKESICITVGIIVFGILTLAVPFFTVDVILALILGVSLAILLHLSYKYKSMWLFDKISRPDRFAQLYVLMDGDLTPHHVEIMCRHKGLDREQTQIILDFAEGNKKSYLAKKYNYSEKTIERKINESIEIINENS